MAGPKITSKWVSIPNIATTHYTMTSMPTLWPTTSLLCSTIVTATARDPFWQQAYTNLVKFMILLRKVTYDYVTLFDVSRIRHLPITTRPAHRGGEADRSGTPLRSRDEEGVQAGALTASQGSVWFSVAAESGYLIRIAGTRRHAQKERRSIGS